MIPVLVSNSAFYIGWGYTIMCMLMLVYIYLIKKPLPNKMIMFRCILGIIVVSVVFIFYPIVVTLLGYLCINCIFIIICGLICYIARH